MFGCVSYDSKLDIGYFYVDTIAELTNLPNLTSDGKGNLSSMNSVCVGSTCDCYEDKNVYVLKGDNTWKILRPIASEGGGGGTITVDSEISTTSENPVQNKVIASALNNKVDTSKVGSASGIAELDENGKVPESQLPSYVDDIIEGYLYDGDFYDEVVVEGYLDSGVFYEDAGHTTVITGEADKYYYDLTGEKFYEYVSSVYAEVTPTTVTGETGKIYVDLNSEKTYRWSGSAFTVVSDTIALGETSSTAYRGDRGKEAYDHASDPYKSVNKTVGLFKFGTTAQGHVKGVSYVTQADITALGIPSNAVASISEKGLMSAGDKLKLDGIDIDAEANVQSDWNETNSTNDAYIKNKPTLATVATTGDYTDLVNLPTLGTAAAKDFTTSVTNGSVDVITSGGVYTKLSSDYYDKSEVQSLIAGGVKYAGAVAFANLPSPSAATEYNFYFVTDAFTTTSDFVIGPGINIPANSCFIVLNIGTALSPVYKYDDFNGYVNISGKQDVLTAGSNITIDSNNVISATDTTYSSLPAVPNGTTVSLVTTGEKNIWNHKIGEWTYLGKTDGGDVINLPASFSELHVASTLNAWQNLDYHLIADTLHDDSAIDASTGVPGGYIYKTGDYTSTGNTYRYADCVSYLVSTTKAKLFKWEHNENSAVGQDFTSYAKNYWYYR